MRHEGGERAARQVAGDIDILSKRSAHREAALVVVTASIPHQGDVRVFAQKHLLDTGGCAARQGEGRHLDVVLKDVEGGVVPAVTESICEVEGVGALVGEFASGSRERTIPPIGHLAAAVGLHTDVIAGGSG